MSEADFEAVLSVNLKVNRDLPLMNVQGCGATTVAQAFILSLLAACGSTDDMVYMALCCCRLCKTSLSPNPCHAISFAARGLPPGLCVRQCLSAVAVCLLLWLQGVFLTCQAAAKQMVAQVCQGTA